MAKLTSIESAHKLALRGDIDAAWSELLALQGKGDIAVNASLAEVAAYRGDWRAVLKLVEPVFSKPSVLRTLNVYTDMVLLTARAGSELGSWAELAKLSKMALSKLTKKDGDAANVAAVSRLARFAERKGRDPMEVRNEREPEFQNGLAKAAKKKFTTPTGRLDHLFGLARAFDYYDGAVALYDQEKQLPNLFDNAVFAASGLARKGREKDAWQAVEAALPRWWPVELTQVAPVILLTDSGLQPLMTAKRCEQILRTPRGPEAVKAK